MNRAERVVRVTGTVPSLEASQRLADGRAMDAEMAGGGAEVAALGDRQEDREEVGIDTHCPAPLYTMSILRCPQEAGAIRCLQPLERSHILFPSNENLVRHRRLARLRPALGRSCYDRLAGTAEDDPVRRIADVFDEDGGGVASIADVTKVG